MSVKAVDIEAIDLSGGTQMRCKVSHKSVDEFVENWQNGVEFDPIEVFFDGVKYWLADGFHRLWSAKKAGLTSIKANIHKGSLRDAILFSCGANAKHGLRRSNEDKRKAVETLLNDPEWSQWSDGRIAESAYVSRPFVSNIRNQVETVSTCDQKEPPKTRGKDGKLYPRPSKNGGSPPPPEVTDEDIEEPVEEESDKEVVEEVVDPTPEPEGPKTWKQNIKSVDAFRVKINELIKMIKDMKNEPGFEELYDQRNRMLYDLGNTKSAIGGSVPFSLCPYCKGIDPDICFPCRGRSWVNKVMFDSAPKEKRDEIERLSSGGGDQCL